MSFSLNNATRAGGNVGASHGSDAASFNGRGASVGFGATLRRVALAVVTLGVSELVRALSSRSPSVGQTQAGDARASAALDGNGPEVGRSAGEGADAAAPAPGGASMTSAEFEAMFDSISAETFGIEAEGTDGAGVSVDEFDQMYEAISAETFDTVSEDAHEAETSDARATTPQNKPYMGSLQGQMTPERIQAAEDSVAAQKKAQAAEAGKVIDDVIAHLPHGKDAAAVRAYVQDRLGQNSAEAQQPASTSEVPKQVPERFDKGHMGSLKGLISAEELRTLTATEAQDLVAGRRAAPGNDGRYEPWQLQNKDGQAYAAPLQKMGIDLSEDDLRELAARAKAREDKAGGAPAGDEWRHRDKDGREYATALRDLGPGLSEADLRELAARAKAREEKAQGASAVDKRAEAAKIVEPAIRERNAQVQNPDDSYDMYAAEAAKPRVDRRAEAAEIVEPAIRERNAEMRNPDDSYDMYAAEAARKPRT